MTIEHSIVVGAPVHVACERWRAAAMPRDVDHYPGSIHFEPIAARRTRVSVRFDCARDGEPAGRADAAARRWLDALRNLQRVIESE